MGYTHFRLYLNFFYNEFIPLPVYTIDNVQRNAIKKTLFYVLSYLKDHDNLEFNDKEQWHKFLL